jgi:hypothetical protein
MPSITTQVISSAASSSGAVKKPARNKEKAQEKQDNNRAAEIAQVKAEARRANANPEVNKQPVARDRTSPTTYSPRTIAEDRRRASAPTERNEDLSSKPMPQAREVAQRLDKVA